MRSPLMEIAHVLDQRPLVCCQTRYRVTAINIKTAHYIESMITTAASRSTASSPGAISMP
jgi:hypothetical protein